MNLRTFIFIFCATTRGLISSSLGPKVFIDFAITVIQASALSSHLQLFQAFRT
jgi:hypothetical protein